MRIRRIVHPISALLLMAAPLAAVPAAAQSAGGAPARPAAIASDTLRLKPGDVIRLQAWREPTLTGDFPVDEGGYAVLPLVGRRVVTRTPWGLLRDSLFTQFRSSLNNESVNITPLRRIFVLGAVLKPGIYMLEPSVGVEGAVALAGGAAQDGTLDRIRIIREGQTLARNLSITRSAGAFSLASGDQLFVDRRHWVDRNSALLLSSFVSLAGVIAVLIRN